MDLDKLIDGINNGTIEAILFTQEHCEWCKKMKDSIVALDLPAKEVKPDSKIFRENKIEVTPTLIIEGKERISRILGYKSPEDLKKSIQDLK